MAFAWIALLAFTRLVTKAGLFPAPLTVPQEIERVEAWLGAAPSVVVEPPITPGSSTACWRRSPRAPLAAAIM